VWSCDEYSHVAWSFEEHPDRIPATNQCTARRRMLLQPLVFQPRQKLQRKCPSIPCEKLSLIESLNDTISSSIKYVDDITLTSTL
jgi:hypothetical protein